MEMTRVVQALAEKYNYEKEHSHQVEKLGEALFNFLRPLHRLSAGDLIILNHACLLHDLGYFINAKDHHKHSYYLIQHDQLLSDYPQEDREVLALVVHNHRKKPLLNSALLGKRDLERVLQLSAIIRIADALDYLHDSRADILNCEIKEKKVQLQIGDLNPKNIKEVLEKKSDLFAVAFGRKISFHQ